MGFRFKFGVEPRACGGADVSIADPISMFGRTPRLRGYL